MPSSPSRVLALWTRALLDELAAGWRTDAARVQALGLAEPDALLGDGPLIPHADMVRVWDQLARRCASDFGVRFGERNAERSIGLLVYASSHAADIGGALDALVRLQRLADTHNELSLIRERDRAVLRHVPPRELSPWPGALAESVLAAAVHLGRSFTGGALTFQRITFQHAQADTRTLERWFGCPIELGAPANDIVMARSALDLRLRAADRAMFSSLFNAAVRAVEQLPADGDFVEAARRAIRERLRTGANIDDVANALHVSARTLQRRLDEAGFTFRRLRDEVRLETLAEIGDGEKRVAIAGKIGFSDASSLRRLRRRSSR